MKHVFIIKNTAILLGALSTVINVIESIYVYVFNKPIFVHLYLVKKKLPKKKKEFLIENISFIKSLTISIKATLSID